MHNTNLVHRSYLMGNKKGKNPLSSTFSNAHLGNLASASTGDSKNINTLQDLGQIDETSQVTWTGRLQYLYLHT